MKTAMKLTGAVLIGLGMHFAGIEFLSTPFLLIIIGASTYATFST